MNTVAEIFAARVPRYTSYPTAPHFHSGIDAQTYSSWLAELPANGSLSLYAHIPFCDTLCWFCGCHTTVVNRYAPVSHYLDLLYKEIALVSAGIAPGQRVAHVHWGGGSPTMLRPDDIARLAGALRSAFDFAPDAEFAVEVDPRGFDADNAAALAAAGVTRASIGVQDLDPVVQQSINRTQSAATTASAAGLLRDVGIRSLNIDLIYGLPHQTLDGIDRTIEQVLNLEPDRLAVFGYAHVPHFKKHQNLIAEAALPDLEARFRQAERITARLCAAGYLAVGLDHFAKPGDPLAVTHRDRRVVRNFQGYTTDSASALIGLGASAIGSLPQGYVQNIADVPGYRAAISENRLPVARGCALGTEDRIRRAVIERLMCDLAVDIGAIARAFGQSSTIFADSLDRLKPLFEQGIVSARGERLEVPPEWRAATRLVCSAFDAYLPGGTARHALAV